MKDLKIGVLFERGKGEVLQVYSHRILTIYSHRIKILSLRQLTVYYNYELEHINNSFTELFLTQVEILNIDTYLAHIWHPIGTRLLYIFGYLPGTRYYYI